MKAVIWLGVNALILAVGAITAIKYPEARITIRVINEEQKPVVNAGVGVGFEVMSKTYFGNEIVPVAGQTNDVGEFTASALADRSLGFTAKKAGYYETTGKYDFT